uniref:hypothetical protein n=1 Tax=Achromobacter sp. TaxID=134375 RepID=UPI00258ADCB4
MSSSLRLGLLALGLACAPLLARAGVLIPPHIPAADAARVDAILARLGAARDFNAVAISADGTRLAWVANTPDGARLTLASIDGSG